MTPQKKPHELICFKDHGKDEDIDDIVRLAMVQFCKMCSESDFDV